MTYRFPMLRPGRKVVGAPGIAAAWPAGAPTVGAIDALTVALLVAPIRVVDPQAVPGAPASGLGAPQCGQNMLRRRECYTNQEQRDRCAPLERERTIRDAMARRIGKWWAPWGSNPGHRD